MRILNTQKTIKLLALLFLASFSFTSCSDDDDHDHDDHDHDHEEINTVRYTLTNTTDANDVIVLTYKDLDGEGGAPAESEVSGSITANSTYTGVLELLHEHEDGDIDNISDEIAEDDAEDHEVFYIANVAGLNITTTDVDGNQNPLGFKTNVTTGGPSIGTLTIALIHEGKKPNDGTVTDALSGAGTTDIEVSFSVGVE